LLGKIHLRNDLLCVEWDVKPYTLTSNTVTAAAAVARCYDYLLINITCIEN